MNDTTLTARVHCIENQGNNRLFIYISTVYLIMYNMVYIFSSMKRFCWIYIYEREREIEISWNKYFYTLCKISNKELVISVTKYMYLTSGTVNKIYAFC